MPDRNTSTATNDNLLSVYFERRAMKTLHDKVAYYSVAQAGGEIYQVPQGEGQQITFNAWRKIGGASSNLAEASANAAVALSSRKVNVSVGSFGRHFKLTDLLEQTSVLNVNEGALREIENSAALTMDDALQRACFKGTGTDAFIQVGQLADTKAKILSALMSARASSFCANTGNAESGRLQWGLPVVFGASVVRLSAVSTTAPSISARLGPIGINKAVTRLKRFSVEPFGDGKYIGIAHPEAIGMLFSNSDWKQWHLNFSGGPQTSMYAREVGIVHNVRLIESANQPQYKAPVAAGAGAHSCSIVTIFGRGCLAAAEIDGSVKYLINRPGSQSTNDPYRLNGTVAFKVRMAGAILNPSAGCHLVTSII